MASDLSTLIQNSICSTLNGLLGKDVNLKETNKSVKKDFQNIQLLKVESTFEFDNITSTWAFYIPARSASLVFNMMLGETSDPIDEIDEDIADALSEFISNLSGGLTTAINAEGFEDLGQSKFTIGANEIVTSEQISNDDIYKFSIDIEDNPISLFIEFDDIIKPFLNVISSSPESVHEEEEEQETEEPTEEIEINSDEVENSPDEPEEVQEEPEQKSVEVIPEDIEKVENSQTEEKQPEEELSDEDKKKKKLKLIIIAIAALLGLTIIAGIVMYFMGMFDPEPVPVKDTNTTKVVKKDGVDVVKYKPIKKTNFSVSQINERRLNARLEALTKYEILNAEEIEAQKIAEKERLYQLQREQELMEFAAKNKEEDIFTRKEDHSNRKIDIKTKFSQEDYEINNNADENKTKETSNIQKTENMHRDNNLKFILVHSLKYKLYKQMIFNSDTKNARISICKNKNGRTAVYIGPFDNVKTQESILDLIQNKNNIDASIANITPEEFDSRCNFE